MRKIARAAARHLLAGLTAWFIQGAPVRAEAPPFDDTPRFLPFAYPPDGAGMMGERNARRDAHSAGAVPGITAPLVAPPGGAPAPPAPVRSRAEVLDELFKRLASASDDGEASGVAARIQRLWLDSGSDTVDLLMSRAADAVGKGDQALALRLLDKIVVIEPDWAEGWYRRATLRLHGDDDDGAMADIGHVLAIEPRHFSALTDMAVIMQRYTFKKDALVLLRKAAAIHPHSDDIAKMIDALTPEVEGRDL